MSQHHEQQQERSRLKNQTKALYQAQRCANPVVRSLEQSSDTGQRRIAQEVLGVRDHELEQQAVAREEPGVREQEQPAIYFTFSLWNESCGTNTSRLITNYFMP